MHIVIRAAKPQIIWSKSKGALSECLVLILQKPKGDEGDF